MYQDFFVKSPLLALPVAALVIFIVVFVVRAVAAWRTRPAVADAMSRLPLDDSEEVHRG